MQVLLTCGHSNLGNLMRNLNMLYLARGGIVKTSSYNFSKFADIGLRNPKKTLKKLRKSK